MTLEWGDPQPTADERTALVEWLEYYRGVLRAKAEGLTDEQARTASVPPSDLTIMGLVRHMAEVERNWFERRLLGNDRGPIYYGEAHPNGDPDGDLHPGPDDTLAEAIATWDTEVEHARAAVAGAASVDDRSALTTPERYPFQPNLRWILLHMIEEYARHCGHADLIRERIDGATDA